MVRVEELPQHAISRTIQESGTESNDETEEERSDTEEIEKEPLDVSTIFQGLTQHDLSTEESDSDAETEAIDWEQEKARLDANEYNAETADRIRNWIEGYQNNGTCAKDDRRCEQEQHQV